MNNSYDRGSYPYWVEFIQERVKYHKDHRKTAQDMDDWDSADGHFCVIEELLYILDQVGVNKEEV
jgi:hypothetical protein